MPKEKQQEKLGRKFGRPDVERCDLFIDMGFLNWGRYNDKRVNFRDSAEKGAQMYSSVPSGGRKKCGLQAASGYFDPNFKTISVNEPYVERWKSMGRPPPHPLKGPWVPSGPSKQHSTPGDNYGTFTKPADFKAFSPLTRAGKGKQRELINFLTNPGKKGNAGYLDICINKYPPHSIGGKIDTYVAAGMLYSKNWKEHKTKIRNGPLRCVFYPQPYFNENPYRDPTIGPTYVQPKEKVYGVNPGIFYPPATPKNPGNNHDGCFTKFPEWSPEKYKTQVDVQKELSNNPNDSELVFLPGADVKSYYTVSVVNQKLEAACNERTWRTLKPITYPQFNL